MRLPPTASPTRASAALAKPSRPYPAIQRKFFFNDTATTEIYPLSPTRRSSNLWKLYDSIAKEKKPSNFYFGNLGGGIRSTASLVKLGEVCEWFQCDNKGRGGDDTPIWGCPLQGRVCHAVQKGKMA